MIDCKMIVSGNRYRLDVIGHGGGEYGKDIVCAAVSIVVSILKAIYKTMAEDCKFLKANISVESGKAVIDVLPKEQFRCQTAFAFYNAECGLHLISRRYPDKVRFDTSCDILKKQSDAIEHRCYMDSSTYGQYTDSSTDGQEE